MLANPVTSLISLFRLFQSPKGKDTLTINAQLAMPHHLLNLALLLQIVQRLPSQTAVDLQPIDERGHRDEPIGLHVFVEFVGGRFVEHDGVVGLVLDCVERELGQF